MMEKYLGEKTRIGNDALERLLPPETDLQPNPLQGRGGGSGPAGGKRLRPAHCLERAATKPEEAVTGRVREYGLQPWRAYTYSLFHDDLPGMDNDDMKGDGLGHSTLERRRHTRGRRAFNVRFL